MDLPRMRHVKPNRTDTLLKFLIRLSLRKYSQQSSNHVDKRICRYIFAAREAESWIPCLRGFNNSFLTLIWLRRTAREPLRLRTMALPSFRPWPISFRAPQRVRSPLLPVLPRGLPRTHTRLQRNLRPCKVPAHPAKRLRRALFRLLQLRKEARAIRSLWQAWSKIKPSPARRM